MVAVMTAPSLECMFVRELSPPDRLTELERI